jgi:hypothetical protein
VVKFKSVNGESGDPQAQLCLCLNWQEISESLERFPSPETSYEREIGIRSTALAFRGPRVHVRKQRLLVDVHLKKLALDLWNRLYGPERDESRSSQFSSASARLASICTG